MTPTPNSAPPVADLRAAAELVRSKPTITNKYDNAASKLARAWLAENPADDDLTVDQAWLRSVGFVDGDYQGMLTRWFGPLQVEVMPFEVDPQWWICNNQLDYECKPRMTLQTRGAVRRLAAALGLPLKESQ